MQNAQRRAALGISLRHSGHGRTVSSTGGSVFRRAISMFTGFTTKKKTAAAIETNVISVDEVAVEEAALVDREREPGEVGLADDRGDDRRDQIGDECG